MPAPVEPKSMKLFLVTKKEKWGLDDKETDLYFCQQSDMWTPDFQKCFFTAARTANKIAEREGGTVKIFTLSEKN